MKPHLFLLTLLVFTILISTVSAVPGQINMVADVGESYIKWDWTGNMTNNDIFLDGNQITVEDEISYYYLGDLNPAEYHILTIINRSSDTTVVEIGVKTLNNSLQILVVYLIMFVLAISLLLIEDTFTNIIVAAFGGTIGIYLLTLIVGFSLFWYVVIGTEVFIGFMVIRTLYERFKEDIAWF